VAAVDCGDEVLEHVGGGPARVEGGGGDGRWPRTGTRPEGDSRAVNLPADGNCGLIIGFH
jgi:hypothetical protein